MGASSCLICHPHPLLRIAAPFWHIEQPYLVHLLRRLLPEPGGVCVHLLLDPTAQPHESMLGLLVVQLGVERQSLEVVCAHGGKSSSKALRNMCAATGKALAKQAGVHCSPLHVPLSSSHVDHQATGVSSWQAYMLRAFLQPGLFDALAHATANKQKDDQLVAALTQEAIGLYDHVQQAMQAAAARPFNAPGFRVQVMLFFAV